MRRRGQQSAVDVAARTSAALATRPFEMRGKSIAPGSWSEKPGPDQLAVLKIRLNWKRLGPSASWRPAVDHYCVQFFLSTF